MLYNLLEGETNANTSNPGSIILIVVMLVVIVGMFIFSSVSNKKKQKQAQDMVNQLKIGDRVKTIGGICGFVYAINDAENTFVLETGADDNKSYVKFDKGAIYQTAPAQGNAVAAPAEKTEKNAEEKAETAAIAEQPEEKTETVENKETENSDKAE